jgi:hypothetical protein
MRHLQQHAMFHAAQAQHGRVTAVAAIVLQRGQRAHILARAAAHVYHCGRSVTWIRPWLWQKRISVATGKRSIWSVGQDQMQPIIGSR